MPFEGIGPVITAFLGGHVDIAITSLGDIKAYIDSGEAKMLAVANEERMPNYPDIPTYKEKGFDVVLPMWDGVSAPKGVPAEIRAKLAEGFKGICSDPELVKKMEEINVVMAFLPAEQFQAMMVKQRDQLAPIIKELGIGVKK